MSADGSLRGVDVRLMGMDDPLEAAVTDVREWMIKGRERMTG